LTKLDNGCHGAASSSGEDMLLHLSDPDNRTMGLNMASAFGSQMGENEIDWRMTNVIIQDEI